jgi:hypothetical protein
MPQPAKPQSEIDFQELIIQAGYRKLAREMHPDAGGSERDFQRLAQAKSALLIKASEDAPSRFHFPHGQATAGQSVQLQLTMEHVSALLAGKPVWWTGENGYRVELILAGGPGARVADVLGKLVERYVKSRKR